MLFGIVIAFWLVLPEASTLVVVTTATLHWASVLLVASAAFYQKLEVASRQELVDQARRSLQGN